MHGPLSCLLSILFDERGFCHIIHLIFVILPFRISLFFDIMGSTGFDSEINRTVSTSSIESQLVNLGFKP